jgi:DNA-binding transcriptional ArsR family regulator
MARSPTTLDAFTAVAEPRRREVLGALAAGEQAVGELVITLGWPQPQVSKHLGVLREVGLVTVRRRGRHRMYSVNGEQLKPIHDWVQMFERLWTQHIDRIKERAERHAAPRPPEGNNSAQGDRDADGH